MSSDSLQDGPLEGIVVADFSRILAGPLCTMVLADLGADVIKVERPDTGDDTRSWGPPFIDGDAAYFLSVNRNRRSIDLDLSRTEDLRTAQDIVDRSDVLVENFRPGVMADLGLAYDGLAADNPGLIYCSIPAFTYAERRHMPGYDLIMQAISGFMSITGEPDRQPVKMGVALLDVVAGLYGAVAVLAALRERELTGLGRRVEVGLFEASVASLVNQATNYLIGGLVPSAAGSAHPNIVPYQGFTAKDGEFVLAAANDKLFEKVCDVVGLSHLTSDARFSTNSDRVRHKEELQAELEATFKTQTASHWVALLETAGVPAAPTRSIDEVFASPEGRNMIADVFDPQRGSFRLVRSPIRYGDGPLRDPTPPPRLGEHADEIRSWIETTRIR